MSVLEDKRKLRAKVKALNSNFLQEDRITQSKVILNKIEQLPSFVNAKTVLLYWSMSDEVETHSFIDRWYKNKNILLPSINGNNLDIKQYSGIDNMQIGENFDILEPIGSSFKRLNAIDMIIVPGIAFDKNNNRMGRGKGYYDRLLQTTQAIKVGICFNFQLFDNVPIEKHDLAMNFVVSTI